MFINMKGLRVNYKHSGSGVDVLLLHGWGGEIGSFRPVHEYLDRFFSVYSLDFPGFGQSDAPLEPWGVDDYTGLVIEFMERLKITQPIVIAHSFGGRVAIKLASKVRLRKLILVDSAGLVPKRAINYYFKVYTYKLIKKLVQILAGSKTDSVLEKFGSRLGSQDYANTSGVMRATFVKVVNEDLRHLLPGIKVPTLLIWGENDQATPVSDGKFMEELIPDSGLVVLKNAGHFSYLDRFNDFILIIRSFLKDDMEHGN